MESRYPYAVEGRSPFVFAINPCGVTNEPRLIQTGRRSNEWVEIVSGVEIGDTVVTSANFLIDSESRLKAAIAGMGGASDRPDKTHTH